jgi:hypothetical protein
MDFCLIFEKQRIILFQSNCPKQPNNCFKNYSADQAFCHFMCRKYIFIQKNFIRQDDKFLFDFSPAAAILGKNAAGQNPRPAI